MKRKREGTLEQYEFSARKTDKGDIVGDDFDAAMAKALEVSICGLPDFLDKADALVVSIPLDGSLRAARAHALALDVRKVRHAMASGVDPNLLYAAVGAGLTFSNLRNEIRDDKPTGSKKIRRADVLDARHAAKVAAKGGKVKQSDVAERLGISRQGLAKRQMLDFDEGEE